MNLSRNLFMAFFFTNLLVSCGRSQKVNTSSTKEAWNEINNPAQLHENYDLEFNKLPLEGEIDRLPWSDSYWPSYKGGIANRWNSSENSDPFTYKLLSLKKLKALTPEKVAELSPAEKYSIYLQDYSYSLVDYERKRNHPTDETWFGLCHGWAPASMNFQEPKPITMTNADGIEIPFGSSDIKALLIFIEQYPLTRGKERSVSDRCNHDLNKNPENANDPECKDMNAGTFHIILANQLGVLKQGVVGDVRRDIQVWNHPIYGFKSEVLNESTQIYPEAAPGTVKIVTVKTEMNYISEINPAWQPAPISDRPEQLASQTYEYNLEINDKGEILGGEWLQSARVDFMWVQEAPTFTDFFEKASEIYNKSIL